MLFFKPNKANPKAPSGNPAELTSDVAAVATPTAAATTDVAPADADGPAGGGWFARLKSALSRSRGAVADGVRGVLRERRTLDQELIEDLETLLLSADVGVAATQRMITGLQQRSRRSEMDADTALASLRSDMLSILSPVAQTLVLPESVERPFLILVVGVNGSGKTTTIGKLCHLFQAQGRKVLLAAGDTFRAAAIEQLKVWGERNGVQVIAQHTGADAASVVFDALQAATSRGAEVVIADTAGRLHTHVGLMEELKKIKRVVGKLDPSAPHEVLLVLDAGTGQNALSQTRQFAQALGVSGIALTKMDGTAKAGVVFALAQEFNIPLRYVGCGEGISDVQPFAVEAFVDALLGSDRSQSL